MVDLNMLHVGRLSVQTGRIGMMGTGVHVQRNISSTKGMALCVITVVKEAFSNNGIVIHV
jgi:hypothetical protein